MSPSNKKSGKFKKEGIHFRFLGARVLTKRKSIFILSFLMIGLTSVDAYPKSQFMHKW